jgi:hypothetical protein
LQSKKKNYALNSKMPAKSTIRRDKKPKSGLPKADIAPLWFVLSPHSLWLMRLALGFVVIADLVQRLAGATELMGPEGAFPLAAANQSSWLFSLYFWSGALEWQISCLIATIAVSIWLVGGRNQRAASIVLWWMFACLLSRTTPTATAGDRLILILLLWSALLPNTRSSKGQRLKPIHGWAVVGVIVQLLLIYPLSILYKEPVNWLWHADILQKILANPALAREPIATWLLTWKEWLPSFARLIWLLEISVVPLWLFTRNHWRLRLGLVGLMIFFHLGLIGCTMRLSIFSQAGAVAWLLVIPHETWSFLFEKRRSPSKGPVHHSEFVTHAQADEAPWIRFVAIAVMTISLFDGAFALLRKTQRITAPSMHRQLVGWLRINQTWDLFSWATDTNRTLAVTGVTLDGTRVNLMDPELPPADQTPRHPIYHRSARWLKFIKRISSSANQAGAEYFADHLMKRWNKTRDPAVVAAEVFVLKRHLPTAALPNPNWEVRPSVILEPSWASSLASPKVQTDAAEKSQTPLPISDARPANPPLATPK